MSELKRARCRSCGASITWAKSKNDKWLPFDYEPATRGTFVIMVELGETEPKAISSRDLEPMIAPLFRDRWVPHWVTCPHADAHRSAR